MLVDEPRTSRTTNRSVLVPKRIGFANACLLYSRQPVRVPAALHARRQDRRRRARLLRHPSLFVTGVAQLLDDAISAIGYVREIDLFDKSVSVALTHHPLSTVSAGEDEVRDLHDGLVAQAGDSIVALAEFLDSMRAHEELLQRDEAGYAFEESK